MVSGKSGKLCNYVISIKDESWYLVVSVRKYVISIKCKV